MVRTVLAGAAAFAGVVALSRAHGAALCRLERTVLDLFDQRSSVSARVARLDVDVARAFDHVSGRVDELERGRFAQADLAFVTLGPDAEDVTS